MSQSRRFIHIGLAVATGLVALVGVVPSSAVSSGSTDTSVVHVNTKGDGWCC